VAAELDRSFVVHATDYVLGVLGLALDRHLRAEAPGVGVRFVPNTPDDAAVLREGSSDLAVGIYGSLPPEMRSRQLLTDRLVCVARRGHPLASRRLTLDAFVAEPHLQIAPRGQPGGYVDDVLAERGLARKVTRAVPYFLTALAMVAETDYLLVVSERIASQHAATLGLVLLEVPLKLRPYALSLLWHPRLDEDPGHRFLRETFVRAAAETARGRHEAPRTRLDEPRRRRKRQGS
jgi:DNA-binding transcriptional LysR family regulator